MISIKVYVYLDESGSIHKNSTTKYFAIGGYYTFIRSKNKIVSMYKKINKQIKDSMGVSLDKELKSFDFSTKWKSNILNCMESIDEFNGVVKVFDKKKMKKDINFDNIFFNYGVKILIKDCILPFIEIDDVEFIISVDNRNVRVGDLDNLQTYLKTEFCLDNYVFKVKYYDSASNYGIQLADLIVNTFYNYYKDKSIVKDVIGLINLNKYKVSLFPFEKNKSKIGV